MQEYNLSKRTESIYDVNVADESGQRFYFTLVKGRGQWRLGPEQLLPESILENEKVLLTAFRSIESIEVTDHCYNN